ncbi:hormone conopressin/conophysin [Octopus vulgaris]|uniref:Hormone conopressin/conophysin n=2 Tax=Octopus TaxID=6643 RepID=A0AA36FIN4_OCTVU|nr:hormone conopressin/conophysin [Octopus vulgaris]
MSSIKSSVFAILIVVVLLPLVKGCFWTSCPIGGKRSNIPATEPRQCMSCGPNGEGQCVGSNICCHKDGCIIGTLAKECNEENESTTACSVKGVPCGTDGQGRCVADGVCCDESACSSNARCNTSGGRSKTLKDLLLILNKMYRDKN